MTPTHGLHVPEAPARPGETPDFRYVLQNGAGEISRPSVDASNIETRHLARAMVRVLDDDGMAVGPWNPQLSDTLLIVGLRHMLLTRMFDDRMERAQRQGRISFYMRSEGEEAVSVAQAMALRPDDMLFPHYRNQGLQVARGRPLVDLMCQLLSNARDMCKGRQLPVFYHWREGHIFSVSGNLGTQYPQAVGWAMAAAIKREQRVAAAWVGEGTTAEADFHSALLFAATYNAPIILNVINNQWAISTFQGVAGGERSTFAERGLGYGIPSLRVDGNDFLAVFGVTAWAEQRARMGLGPTLIELVTYRAAPHSTSDDPSRYRPRDEHLAWPLGDPVVRLTKHLIARGAWSDGEDAKLRDALQEEVASSWKEAVGHGSLSEGPRLSPDTMFEDVYKAIPEQLLRQREALRRELRAAAEK